MRQSPTPLGAALVVAGSSTWFVISTITMDQIPDAALMALSLLSALVFVSVFAGTPTRAAMGAASRPQLALAAGAGVMTWLAPALIVLNQRATDAPSGTETLFFTTAVWALLGSLVALGWRDERPVAAQVVAVALGVLGSAALLANWERPSSFSPFVKFPLPEAVMIAAGVLFVLGLLMGKHAARILGARTSLWFGVAGATAVAILLALPSGFGELPTLQRHWPQLLIAGASLAALSIGLTSLVRVTGLARATAWLLVAPVALTMLSVVERLTVVYGPNPIIWAGVLGGGLLALIGLTIVQCYPGRVVELPTPGPRMSHLIRAARAIALAATVAGAIAIFLPAFSAVAVGTLDTGEAFSVKWLLLGAESAVGWLALLGSLLALSLTFGVLQVRTTRRLVAATATAAAFLAYPLLLATPLRTWNRWIPAEIQQAYGTEYARLSIDAVPNNLRLASAVLALLACVTLITVAVLGPRARDQRAQSEGDA